MSTVPAWPGWGRSRRGRAAARARRRRDHPGGRRRHLHRDPAAAERRRQALVKTRPHPPADFFAVEARGLPGWPRRAALPSRGAGRRRRLPDRRLGRDRAPQRRGGRAASAATWPRPTPPAPARSAREPTATSAPPRCRTRPPPTWAEFFATRRVLPYLRAARDRDALDSTGDAAAIDAVAARIDRARRARRAAGAAARRPVVGQLLWGADGTGAPGRPGGARRPPRDRPRDAGAVRRAAPGRGCSTPTTRRPRWPTAGATGCRCTSCTRCWCTPSLFGGSYGARAGARGPRRARPAGGSSPPDLSAESQTTVAAWAPCASWSSTTTAPFATPCAARWSSTATRSRLANDGAEALARINGRAPDAIVMDVMMPRLDGIETTKALRAAGNDLPILVLTARDAVGDRVDGLDAGADDYLAKPFALEELLARVRALTRRAVRRHGRRRRADAAVVRRPVDEHRHPRGRRGGRRIR